MAVLRTTKYGDDHFAYNVIRFNTPNVVKEYPLIGGHITYLSEFVHYPSLTEKHIININKSINLVFKRSVLAENHEQVAENIKELLSKVTDEHELLKQDHLARGKLLEPVWVSAWLQNSDDNGRWVYSYKQLQCPYDPEDPDEYWGNISLISSDVISGATRYPWMISDISKHEPLL